MSSVQDAIAAAIEQAPEQIGTPVSGRNGATVTEIDILHNHVLAARLAAHKRGERGPVFVLCLPKYAPRGTAGWVYTVERVDESGVSCLPVGGGRGLLADAIVLADADRDDLRAYAALRG